MVEEEKKKVEEEKKVVEAKPTEEKEPVKEEKKVEVKKKEKSITRGKDLWMSTKHSIAICKFIKNKKINEAMDMLNLVIKKKKAVPMVGELPHRKGIERGRYPIKASKIFIKLLKSLDGNSRVNGIENPLIKTAKADVATRPYRRFGSRRFKRTNVLLVAGEGK